MTREEETEVRRALAALAARDRTEAPLPPDVAAQLDDRLAALVAERTAPTPLRPRPRRGPRLLVAAVTVAVVALGTGVVWQQVSGRQGESAMSQGSSGSSADQREQAGSGGSAGSGAGPSTATSRAPRSARRGLTLAGGVVVLDGRTPRLRDATLDQDVRATADRLGGASTGQDPRGPAGPRPCTVPRVPAGGQAVAVSYEGRPAVLVLRPADHGVRRAQVFDCGGGRAARTVTVPSR